MVFLNIVQCKYLVRRLHFRLMFYHLHSWVTSSQISNSLKLVISHCVNDGQFSVDQLIIDTSHCDNHVICYYKYCLLL